MCHFCAADKSQNILSRGCCALHSWSHCGGLYSCHVQQTAPLHFISVLFTFEMLAHFSHANQNWYFLFLCSLYKYTVVNCFTRGYLLSSLSVCFVLVTVVVCEVYMQKCWRQSVSVNGHTVYQMVLFLYSFTHLNVVWQQ